MALEPDGGGGAKRRRMDEKGGQRQEAAAGPEAAPVDRISALPDDVRRRILIRLPLKYAIRSAALAQGWRDLWKSRWACRDIRLLPGDNPREVLESLESVPRRRLYRFCFVSDNEKLRQPHLKRFLAYTAECRVEDLHVEVRRCKIGLGPLIFHLPHSSPRLVHLSLRNINLIDMYYQAARPFSALETIHLHSVNIGVKFGKLMALCPRLHTLDLRRCGYNLCGYRTPRSLRRITIAECNSGHARLNIYPVPSLCSFRYSDRFLSSPFYLPSEAALTDLYICFSDREPILQCHGYMLELSLPDDLSGLRVLTICSNALKIASSLFNDTARFGKMNSLQSLRELQLLMLEMEMDNLANTYQFLEACHCSNLEKLFVQLPVNSNVPLEDTVKVQAVLPQDVFVKLRMVKVMNFNWRRFEVQLVSLLLRKATSLHKMLLVSPNVDPLHVPGVQEADFSLLKEALASGRIIVSESDDPATQPFHSEVFYQGLTYCANRFVILQIIISELYMFVCSLLTMYEEMALSL